jgi:hypothetical protein
MALLQTVLAQRAVDKGLGQKIDLLEDEQVDSYYKVCIPSGWCWLAVVIFISNHSTPMQLTCWQ